VDDDHLRPTRPAARRLALTPQRARLVAELDAQLAQLDPRHPGGEHLATWRSTFWKLAMLIFAISAD
jgi:hypothetical protein